MASDNWMLFITGPRWKFFDVVFYGHSDEICMKDAAKKIDGKKMVFN